MTFLSQPQPQLCPFYLVGKTEAEVLAARNPFITGCFQNVLCIPFINCSMTNIRKPLQMNIIMFQKYYFGIA